MSRADRDLAAEALVTLRTRVDAHFEGAATRAGPAMRCASGCETCCHVDLSVFEVEADAIREALTDLPGDVRARVRTQADRRDRCAMLVEGRCAVYAQRPLICRSHGLAVQTDDGDIEHCPLNFTQARPDPAGVLRLAAINEPLSVMATLWDGEGKRVALRTLAAEG